MNTQLTQARTMITRLVVMDTGTFNPMFRRSYVSNVNPGTFNIIAERVDQADRFNPMLLSGVAGQFLQPAATPENANPIAITGGWEQKRGRFMLEVVHEFPGLGSQIVEQITGFTDYDGFTTTGAIDEKMVFYVNSCMQLRHTQLTNSPFGPQQGLVVTDNSHVLADPGFSTIYSPEKEQRMRPEDVFSAMSRLQAVTEGNTTDMRTTLTNVALKSRRTNTLPSEYMGAILDNHRVAAISQELGSGEHDILTAARGKAAEPSAPRDPFLAAMAQVRNTPVSKVFTYNDLRILDPNVDNVKAVGFMSPAERAQTLGAVNTQSWGGSDRETVIATMLAQGVVALMMEIGISVLGFTATNQTLGGMLDYRPFNIRGFSEANMAPLDHMFRDQFAGKLWKDIATIPGSVEQFLLSVQVQARVMGQTDVTVQFENNPPVPFTVPTFCDSLFVPVVTTNVAQAETLARDFRELISFVQNETSSFQAYDAGGNTVFGTT